MPTMHAYWCPQVGQRYLVTDLLIRQLKKKSLLLIMYIKLNVFSWLLINHGRLHVRDIDR